eukprot:jgi/Ulvmu1/6706/UM030_0039.1
MDTNLLKAVKELPPQSRRKLLQLADNLGMHLRKMDLDDPSGSKANPEQPKLGVLRLEYDYEPAVGDIDHPGSFAYPVEYCTVKGLSFKICQAGERNEELDKNFQDAVQWLIDQGCDAITGDCGFMYWYQEDVRLVTDRPMMLSALCQLPAVTAAFDDKEKIAIFTANSETLKPMLPKIKKNAGVDLEKDRYVIIGCQDVPGFDAVEKGEPVIYDEVAPGMVDLTRKVLEDYPSITAVLLECTELPQFADVLRKEFKLPVYTAVTCTDHFMAGLLDNPRFGLQDWHDEATVGKEKRKEKRSGMEGDAAAAGGSEQRPVEDILKGLQMLVEA